MLGYFIAERRPELGIRKSLGADGRDVVRLVVGQGMRPVLVGLAAGLGAAYAGVHLLQTMLFGVAGRDPARFVAVAGFPVIIPSDPILIRRGMLCSSLRRRPGFGA